MATTKNNWSTDRISNMVILNLINHEPEYPWHLAIEWSHSGRQFEWVLPKLITSQNKVIYIHIDTDDCIIEFSSEIPNLNKPDPKFIFTIDDIIFKAYFD